MSLASLVDNDGLPLNRKERFYTGTVLPSILCADNFSHLHRLSRVLPGCPELAIDASPNSTNLQFFTEYGLWESIFDPVTRRRFPNPPPMRDTPDIVIFIGGEHPVIVALEAKMFHRPPAMALAEQMSKQAVLLGYAADVLSVPASRVVHVALLPDGLLAQPGYDEITVPAVTWQQLLKAFLEGRSPDYWTSMLQLALERYDTLASHVADFAYSAHDQWTGRQIYEDCKDSMPYNLMGREGGLDGPRLAQDLLSGSWESRVYQVRKGTSLPSKNWFPIAEFIARVESQAEVSLRRRGPQPSAIAVEVVEGAVEQLRAMGVESLTAIELFEAAKSIAWDMGYILTKADVWVAVHDWAGFDYYDARPPDSTVVPL